MPRHQKIENLIGQKFNMLTAISIDKQEKSIIYYNCRCDCTGKIVVVNANHLRKGLTKSCGCQNKKMSDIPDLEDKLKEMYIVQKKSMSEIGKFFGFNRQAVKRNLQRLNLLDGVPGYDNKFKDLTGQIFAHLTVLNYSHKKGKRHLWFCECVCTKKIVADGSHLRSGHTKSCGMCQDADSLARKSNYVGELSKTFWSSIKRCADVRYIVFEVSPEYAWQLFQKQNGRCALTNLYITLPYDSKDMIKGYKTASFDRIDSMKGYVEGNVQWVHKDANLMKQDYNESHFKYFCKLITETEEYKHYQG